MKKSKIAGWKDVFLFTFSQTFKSKAFVVVFILFLAVAAFSMPVIHLITASGNSKGEIGKLEKVYVLNQTSIQGLDFSGVSSNKELEELTVVSSDEEYDVLIDRLEGDESTSLILMLTEEMGGYQFHFIRSGKKDITNANMDFAATYFLDLFEEQRYAVLGVTKEQKEIAGIPIRIEMNYTDTSGEPVIHEDTKISQGEYFFIYGLLITIFLVNTMASTRISSSIVMDKSSKVIEYLLTTIKPLAIIIGKVLAMLSAVLIQAVLMILMVFLSNKLTSIMFEDAGNVLGSFMPDSIFSNFNFINILLCLLMAGLGLVCYAIIAGLTGACISRIEDMNEGMTLFTLINLAGFYVGIIAASSMMTVGDSPMVTFALLFPLSSPFFLPGAVLIGKAGIVLVCASILILVIFVTVVFMFTAKVFEVIILHNGNKIGIKELFKMSKAM